LSAFPDHFLGRARISLIQAYFHIRPAARINVFEIGYEMLLTAEDIGVYLPKEDANLCLACG